MAPLSHPLLRSFRRFILGYGKDDELITKPRFLALRSARWFIIFTVVLGIYVDIFLYGSTVVVLPFVLEEQAGVAHEDIGRYTGYSMLAYGIASFVSSPIAGFLADKAQNRREPLLLGLLFLFAGCICLWVANNIHVLLLGRVLQGVSAGFVWSIGLALIADTVGFEEVGEILAYADISLCFGLATAPLISGTVLKKLGEDAVYGLIMIMIVMDVMMRLFLIERKTAKRFESVPNAAFVNAAGPDKEMPQVVEHVSSSETTEVDGKEPKSGYLDYAMVLLRSWRMIGALIGTWASAHILISIDVVIPVYCEDNYEWDALWVGILLFTFYTPSLLCIVTGRLADRYGGRWLALGGFLGCVPCFLGLTAVDQLSKDDAPALLWILMPCAGISLAFATTPVMAEVVYTLQAKQPRYPVLRQNSGGYGLAYGMFMTVFSLGCVTGSAGSPPLLELDNGWDAVMYSLAGICVLTAGPVVLWTGPKSEGGRLGMRKPHDVELQGRSEAS